MLASIRERAFAVWLCTAIGSGGGVAASAESASELAGLWEAKLRFGPEIRGTLTIEHAENAWRAEIAGQTAPARVAGDTLTFDLPEDRGAFRGYVAGRRITGHWIQAPSVTTGGRNASPVTLTRVGRGERWRGDIHPLADEFTMYLVVQPTTSGPARAFLRNPERNLGRFIRVAALERDGNTVRLLGASKAGVVPPVLTEGVLRDDVLSLPLRGGTYDFRRVGSGAGSDFYPRLRPGAGAAYQYRPPPAGDDGWAIGTPEDAGLSRSGLETFVRTIIDAPIDSLSTPYIHSVLVARHGKLVLEEYFHGEHRDKPHDTRSAAKSVTATLLGAAIQSGVRLDANTPVYQVMYGGAFPAGLEPRKRALTLEHLLTMTAGFDCDDSDDNSPGHEDRVAEQTDEPDWWKLTLELGMIREPGERAVYCSIEPHLVGGVLRKVTGRPLPELFHEVLAEPLDIHRYWLGLTPTHEAYMGGGARFLSRDFIKFGQLMLNGGTWRGRRVVSEAWARRSVSPLVQLGKWRYGYLWWVREYPYQGRTLQAFYAGGNGGQVVLAIPELDLVVAFTGGNYADMVMFQVQTRWIPDFVLPAVVTQ